MPRGSWPCSWPERSITRAPSNFSLRSSSEAATMASCRPIPLSAIRLAQRVRQVGEFRRGPARQRIAERLHSRHQIVS